MKKVFEKAKQIARSAEAKYASAAAIGRSALMMAASAEETTSIDVSAINSAFTSGFQSMVTNSISMISAMVPIGLTLAGTIFLVRKAMSWFKGMAK